ncbi:MAG: hypothetical protein ACO3YQ_05680 [Flavobacteriales bacterium]|jgi:hypothetical protein
MHTERPVAVPGSTIVVHVRAQGGAGYRIWPTTAIHCTTTGATGRLLSIHNVAAYPDWHHFDAPGWYSLVFETLPPECTHFTVFEDIPESGGLHLQNCPRLSDDTVWLDPSRSWA